MKESEKSLQNKLTIINYEKLKDKRYPANASTHSFVFQLKVVSTEETQLRYNLTVEYGYEELQTSQIEIGRWLVNEPLLGYHGFKVEIPLGKHRKTHYFTLAKFETPNSLLKEISSIMKTEYENLPF